jgi:hypothetical protein
MYYTYNTNLNQPQCGEGLCDFPRFLSAKAAITSAPGPQSHVTPKARSVLTLPAVLVAALQIVVSIPAEAETTGWHELEKLHKAIREADQRGDLGDAANAAERCVAITTTIQTQSKIARVDYYCAYYLSSALRNGRGTPRDEHRALMAKRSNL